MTCFKRLKELYESVDLEISATDKSENVERRENTLLVLVFLWYNI